ncbi:MAG: alpha/beta hydrolase [Nevskia sp.]|nr:alpha/beta hydrolase [Nevskia sp.]
MPPKHLVCFAHGKESGPWGVKITRLAETARRRGFEVLSPDYSRTPDPRARLAQLLQLRPQAQHALVLVGSSMGGWVSAMATAALRPNAVLLIAPALYFPGYDAEPPAPPALTAVVHGWDDDIVPVERAIRYAQKHRALLHLLDSGHTLNDRLPMLELLFDQLLQRALLDAAYRATDYVVASGVGDLVLHVDRYDAAIEARLIDACGLRQQWVLLSASNPGSQQLSTDDNRTRIEALRREIEQADVPRFAVNAHDPAAQWPDEISELLCDPPTGFAEDLARRYGQNAIVRGQLGAAPELLWL